MSKKKKKCKKHHHDPCCKSLCCRPKSYCNFRCHSFCECDRCRPVCDFRHDYWKPDCFKQSCHGYY